MPGLAEGVRLGHCGVGADRAVVGLIPSRASSTCMKINTHKHTHTHRERGPRGCELTSDRRVLPMTKIVSSASHNGHSTDGSNGTLLAGGGTPSKVAQLTTVPCLHPLQPRGGRRGRWRRWGRVGGLRVHGVDGAGVQVVEGLCEGRRHLYWAWVHAVPKR